MLNHQFPILDCYRWLDDLLELFAMRFLPLQLRHPNFRLGYFFALGASTFQFFLASVQDIYLSAMAMAEYDSRSSDRRTH